MNEHLSTLQIKQLCVSSLQGEELAAAAVHTAECKSCHRRFVEELRRQRGSTQFNFTLEPEFWFRHDHVDFDQLVALADKTLDEETREIINIHLQTCERCREDVSSFLAFREAGANEMDISHGPTSYVPSSDISGAPWWQRFQSGYALAAIVLVAIAVLIGLLVLNSRSDRREANRQDQAAPGIERSPIVSSSPNEVSTSPPDDLVKVAVLNDGAGEVTIYKNGRVTGLDDVGNDSREDVARAGLAEQLEAPDVLKHLSGDQSGLRGDGNDRPGFRLLYPVRSVITEDRPIFRWESLPGVSGYRVYVLDADSKQVSQSEELPPAKTEWKAPPLRRGQTFSWVVTALVDGKKVISPSASAPEMNFAILSAADFQELSRVKKSNSHLALGVFYTRTGLLNDAEHEFQSLIKLNPQSELPRKLLQSVRSMKQRN